MSKSRNLHSGKFSKVLVKSPIILLSSSRFSAADQLPPHALLALPNTWPGCEYLRGRNKDVVVSLSIYQFIRDLQSFGSGRHLRRSLMARRRPRVNQESFPRASLAGWRSGCFFSGSWIVGVVPHAGRDRPIEGESHDQYQAGETVGIAQMGLFKTKPARFEIRKHGLDTPARGVSQGGEISRLGRHSDDPGLGMPRIADDAQVGRDPLAGKDDLLEIVAAR